jgi:hypothetical protein
MILRSFGFLHPKVVRSEASQPNASDKPRFPIVKVAGREGNCVLNVRGSAILGISIERFGRNTRLPLSHDAVRNRVSMSRPGMSARRLVAPVVAFKYVLQPILRCFARFPQKTLPHS